MQVLADRLSQIQPSITLALTAKAAQLKASGRNIISFGAGEPDCDTPVHAQNAGINAIQSGKTRYTAVSGIPELKTSICQYFSQYRQLPYTPDNILVSCGAKHSIANAMLALLNPGDEVILPAPYWVSYPDQIRLAGGVPKIIPCQSNAIPFKLTPDQLTRAITPKTKLLILNSPSNPTGACYTKAELQALAPVIESAGLFVLSDEIYSQLTYESACSSPASLSSYLYDHTLVIDGVSKAYAMTGWRIGFVAAPVPIAKAMTTIQSQMTSNPSTPAQYASVAALAHPIDPGMLQQFRTRRDRAMQLLAAMPGISCAVPDGAFYLFPSIRACLHNPSTPGGMIPDAMTFCERLLTEHDVVCVPGEAFGDPSSIRLSYALDEASLVSGLQRLHEFLGSLV